MCRAEDNQENLTEDQNMKAALSETWSQDAQDELENFIEQQRIYIRQ